MVLDVSRITASSARWRQREKHKHISWSCKRLQYLLMCKNYYRLKCEQRTDRKERNKDNNKRKKKQTRQRESVCNKQTCLSLVLVVIPAHRDTFCIEQASTILTWWRCWSCQISKLGVLVKNICSGIAPVQCWGLPLIRPGGEQN